ncbi:unnamed protein product, partial [Heterotrigona itama]
PLDELYILPLYLYHSSPSIDFTIFSIPITGISSILGSLIYQLYHLFTSTSGSNCYIIIDVYIGVLHTLDIRN